MRRVEGDNAVQDTTLDVLSDAANYRRWLCALAAPWLGNDPLEIGSGNGDYAAEMLRTSGHITVSEGDESRLQHLQERFASEPHVQIRALHLPVDEDGSYTSAVAYNVLEHIPDDVGALRSLGRLVREAGKVIVLVPAFEIAMSRFDREIGHVRRYTAGSLRDAADSAGLEIVRLHYVNSIGLPTWVLAMRCLRMRPHNGIAVRAWDRIVVPPVQRIEARWRPPFGQSVFMVAKPSARGGHQMEPRHPRND